MRTNKKNVIQALLILSGLVVSSAEAATQLLTVCLKGRTISIVSYLLPTYVAVGATPGLCRPPSQTVNGTVTRISENSPSGDLYVDFTHFFGGFNFENATDWTTTTLAIPPSVVDPSHCLDKIALNSFVSRFEYTNKVVVDEFGISHPLVDKILFCDLP